MASLETWKKLKHFKPKSSDNWGDIDAINDDLLLCLDDFRSYINCAIYVTNGVATEGHSKKSYHYRENGACAVDVVIPGYARGPLNLILDAQRFGFRGIGYYPHWKYGGKVVGGLHLDMRPLLWDPDGTKNYGFSRWIGIPKSEYIDGKLIKKLEYLPMSYENIKKYGGIYGHDL